MSTNKIGEARHARLVQAVSEAIENLFSDTTVEKDQTCDDLRDIICDCRMKIDSMGKRP